MRCKVEVTIYLQGHDYKRDSRHTDTEHDINQDIACYQVSERIHSDLDLALGLWFLDNY